jgi:hypothetical protein
MCVVAAPGESPHDGAYRDLCNVLSHGSLFPYLQHIQFGFEEKEQGWPAKIPRRVLRTASVLQQLEVVTFSAVELSMVGLQEFLPITKAHTLRFYNTRLFSSEYAGIPDQFTVSTCVAYLDIRGAGHRFNKAMLKGVLAKPRDSGRNDKKIRLTVDPKEMTSFLWDAVGEHWGFCQILELKAEAGLFDQRRPGHIFQCLSANSCHYNNIKELRLTNPEFSVGSSCFFQEFLHNSKHLESLRICGWTVPHHRGTDVLWDMECLLSLLVSTINPIIFVFEEAPFDALVALLPHVSELNVKLLQMDVQAPPDTWWPGDQEAGLRMVADKLVAVVKESKTLGVIRNAKMRNWAMLDCYGGFWVGIKDRSFLSASDLNKLKTICVENYTTESSYVFRNIRSIMNPTISAAEARDGEEIEQEPLRHPSGATYIRNNAGTDRVLHYL